MGAVEPIEMDVSPISSCNPISDTSRKIMERMCLSGRAPSNSRALFDSTF